MLNKKYINFKTCTCSVDVWMGIICVDVNGLSFWSERIQRVIIGYRSCLRCSHKAYKQCQQQARGRLAPRYLLDCFQCSVIKGRCDLNNSNSGHCSICCPSRRCLCLYFDVVTVVSIKLAQSQTGLQLPELVNWHCHSEAIQKNTRDNTQPEIKPIIHTQLGKLGRICLFGFHWKPGDLLLPPGDQEM